MSYDEILTASVIRYPYLWAWQARDGETEGRKERPVAVGVRIPRPDGDLLVMFPITSQKPDARRFAVEVPTIEKKRAGLDQDRQLWIILDEYNSDAVGRSFYLEPTAPIGRFSKAFFLPLVKEFIARRRASTEVSRHR